MVEDVMAIRKLHHLYGYFIDKCLYNETVDLFADDGVVRFFGGIWRGKKSVRRLYVGRFRKNFTGDHNGPVDGFLLDHMQMQDVIDVAPDRRTAKGRFRAFMAAGRHAAFGGPRQWWEGGLYENEYVREGSIWKISLLNYHPQWHADYETGWAHTRPAYLPFFEKTLADGDPADPDEIDRTVWLWPRHDVLPFHNAHPVTGRPVAAAERPKK
jgi:carotenoid cleavage dioxygenase